ncbi:MAG TPA: imidazoleglycerol-phosphate dehydratase HisB [Chthoniobacteraceae bacterium]|nr:imidazoleglycerol-phosphate dehydratase HisB [Chthoniobacteraceae bacterium]
MSRTSKIERKTSETQISIELEIDGSGKSVMNTKIPFFDHMLTLFARHGLLDLNIAANGDIEVDLHHTVEDVGISLGQAFTKALGDKSGIRRYGWAYVPMDETLTRAVIDFSGRPYIEYRAPAGVAAIGAFDFQLVEEFLRAFSVHSGTNLHVEILYGRDAHHMAESVFKALAKAVDQACQIDPRVQGVPSTKGVL